MSELPSPVVRGVSGTIYIAGGIGGQHGTRRRASRFTVDQLQISRLSNSHGLTEVILVVVAYQLSTFKHFNIFRDVVRYKTTHEITSLPV